jgi:hypothetical protein
MPAGIVDNNLSKRGGQREPGGSNRSRGGNGPLLLSELPRHVVLRVGSRLFVLKLLETPIMTTTAGFVTAGPRLVAFTLAWCGGK